MDNRFDVIFRQDLTVPDELLEDYDEGHKIMNRHAGHAIVLRDNQTGVMYLWTQGNSAGGLTALISKDGNPMTSYKVTI